MTAAVIIHRFGPYHVARLKAAAAVGPVVGIELSARTNEYAWAPVESGALQRETLIDNDAAVTPRELIAKLESALGRINPDVVFLNGWSGSIPPAALLWCHRNNCRAVLMSESSYGDEPRNALKEWMKRRLVSGMSSALVGGRRHTEYAARLGLPAENCFLGYDAVDNEYFEQGAAAARADRDKIRTRFGLPERYFLASNRFIPKKNLSALIAAFSEYRRRIGDNAWDLVLLGDGPLRTQLETQIESSGLSSAVHLPGFRQYEDLPAYYGLAGGFVHASTSEQWGLVVNEALASGLPVVVSNACGCAPELVANGVNGWVFDPNSPNDLSEKLAMLAGLGDLRGDYAESGRNIVSRFGPERFADGFWKAAMASKPVSLSRANRWLLQARTLR